MALHDYVQVLLFLGLLCAVAPLLGRYAGRVLTGEKTWLSPLLRGVEKSVYRLGGVDQSREMTWKQYWAALLLFNAVGLTAVFGLQLLQHLLPLNPQSLPLVKVDSVLVEQALANLVLNAVQYTPAHSRIFLSASRESEWLVLSVED